MPNTARHSFPTLSGEQGTFLWDRPSPEDPPPATEIRITPTDREGVYTFTSDDAPVPLTVDLSGLHCSCQPGVTQDPAEQCEHLLFVQTWAGPHLPVMSTREGVR